ncbi:MAG: bem46 protein [Comamonadaceae bacterium]|nr:MAG: bem46 protein [Comamonadaceae bacterium]
MLKQIFFFMVKSGSPPWEGRFDGETVGRWWLIVCLLGALSGCAWLTDQQRQIIYRPTLAAQGSSVASASKPQFYELQVPAPGAPAHISLWWLPHAAPEAPTLLYLHGTFRNLEGNRHKIESLQQAGFSILAVDYRGWGHSTAITPSEQSILADARLAWAELVRREPRPAQRVIYGHSMGSAVAVDLASQLNAPKDYGGLMLESAFTSFADVARSAGFWARVLALFSTERFASIEKIGQIHAPLLMLHGTQDDTIPITLGEQLFAAANAPKQWVSIEAGWPPRCTGKRCSASRPNT